MPRNVINYTPGRGKIVSSNVNNYYTPGREKIRRDRRRAQTQMYNNCEETHLGGEVLSPY